MTTGGGQTVWVFRSLYIGQIATHTHTHTQAHTHTHTHTYTHTHTTHTSHTHTHTTHTPHTHTHTRPPVAWIFLFLVRHHRSHLIQFSFQDIVNFDMILSVWAYRWDVTEMSFASVLNLLASFFAGLPGSRCLASASVISELAMCGLLFIFSFWFFTIHFSW